MAGVNLLRNIMHKKHQNKAKDFHSRFHPNLIGSMFSMPKYLHSYLLSFIRISAPSRLTNLMLHNVQWQCLSLGDIKRVMGDGKVYLFPDITACNTCDVTKRPTSVGYVRVR